MVLAHIEDNRWIARAPVGRIRISFSNHRRPQPNEKPYYAQKQRKEQYGKKEKAGQRKEVTSRHC